MPNISDFYQDQYPATDQLQCITIYIPEGDAFKWLLAGLLRLPSMTSSYQDPDSEQAQGLADIWRDGYDLTDWEGCVDENRIGYVNNATLWYNLFTVITGAGIVVFVDAAQIWNYYASANPGANGDSSYHDLWLPAGTYQVKMVGCKRTQAGKVNVILSNEETLYSETVFNEVDFYSASFVRNTVVTTEITLTEDIQRCYVNTVSKNASSTAYLIPLTCLEFTRKLEI